MNEDTNMSLTEQVKSLLAKLGDEQSESDRCDALRHASELDDMYSFVTPQVSTLPLDAMAGFPVIQKEKMLDNKID